jgi:hypothetical protein
MLVEALLVRPPCLKRAAGNIKRLGGLTQGEPLGLQAAILRKQFSTFDAIPALVTILIATLLVMDYGSHSYLLVLESLLWGKYMAQDGEVALLLQPYNEVEMLIVWGRQLDQVANAVIKACPSIGSRTWALRIIEL